MKGRQRMRLYDYLADVYWRVYAIVRLWLRGWEA